jgi:hypothetical protein
VDAVVYKLYQGILGSYWEKERKLVEEGYHSVQLPETFGEIVPPRFEMSAKWSLEHWIGYLGTWSALQTFINQNGSNPIEVIYPDLKAAWAGQELRTVRWPLALRVGRVRPG